MPPQSSAGQSVPAAYPETCSRPLPCPVGEHGSQRHLTGPCATPGRSEFAHSAGSSLLPLPCRQLDLRAVGIPGWRRHPDSNRRVAGNRRLEKTYRRVRRTRWIAPDSPGGLGAIAGYRGRTGRLADTIERPSTRPAREGQARDWTGPPSGSPRGLTSPSCGWCSETESRKLNQRFDLSMSTLHSRAGWRDTPQSRSERLLAPLARSSAVPKTPVASPR